MISRVSQRQMYSNFLFNMNSTLSAYMESHLQSSTQKKVNRPSDDPYGSSQIMASRTSLASIGQFMDNLSISKGWLNAAEGALGQVQDSLVAVMALLEQASTGTYNASQRDIMSYEMRQHLEQMVTYANTKFNGHYIFGGHKTNVSPYSLTLGAHSRDVNMQGVEYVVERGALNHTAIVKFSEDGTTAAVAGAPTFDYSLDGGATWLSGTAADWAPPASVPPLPGSPVPRLNLRDGSGVVVASVALHDPNRGPFDVTRITAADPTAVNETGTWIYVRPTAEYNGDTNDPVVMNVRRSGVLEYPYSPANLTAAGAAGVFRQDVSVRLYADANHTDPNTIYYEYSLDNGVSWKQAEASRTNPVLAVGSGFLTLNGPIAPGDLPQASPVTPSPANPLGRVEGDQFVIRPHRADIDLTIGSNASITVNNVGCDIFGGIYEQPFSQSGPALVTDDLGKNIFEVLGRALGYLETNSQQGCQEMLALCLELDKHIGTTRATIGARTNRVEAVSFQLEALKIDETDRLSSLEDVDLSELMVRLSQQQLAYQSVLQSSAMIMQMGLMNYI